MCRALVRFYQRPINVEKTGIPIKEKYGNILMNVFVRLASGEYVFYVSLQSFMTYGQSVKKKYSHSFLTVFFISITPRSLAPKFSRSPITTRSPIPRSQSLPNHLRPPIARSPTSDSFFEGGKPTFRPNAYPKKKHFPTLDPTMILTKNPTTNLTSSLQQQQTPL